jgi:hypothetical protein
MHAWLAWIRVGRSAIVALLTVLMPRGENVVYEAPKGHGEAGAKVTTGDLMEPRELA